MGGWLCMTGWPISLKSSPVGGVARYVLMAAERLTVFLRREKFCWKAGHVPPPHDWLGHLSLNSKSCLIDRVQFYVREDKYVIYLLLILGRCHPDAVRETQSMMRYTPPSGLLLLFALVSTLDVVSLPSCCPLLLWCVAMGMPDRACTAVFPVRQQEGDVLSKSLEISGGRETFILSRGKKPSIIHKLFSSQKHTTQMERWSRWENKREGRKKTVGLPVATRVDTWNTRAQSPENKPQL